VTWYAYGAEGTFYDVHAAIVSLPGPNEAPQITSNGGGDTASISIAERGCRLVRTSRGDPPL
jgi:hypothetical protein